jgi:hypothetical protein
LGSPNKIQKDVLETEKVIKVVQNSTKQYRNMADRSGIYRTVGTSKKAYGYR